MNPLEGFVLRIAAAECQKGPVVDGKCLCMTCDARRALPMLNAITGIIGPAMAAEEMDGWIAQEVGLTEALDRYRAAVKGRR